MTDELTPQELEALKNLPRERTPNAQLEDRVVAAMRDKGILAKKPRRTVQVTFPRVAALVAASVALVIGAYSVGLNRGDERVIYEPLERISTDAPRQSIALETDNLSEASGRSDATAPPAAKPNETRERAVLEAEEATPATPLEKKSADATESLKDEDAVPRIVAESATPSPAREKQRLERSSGGMDAELSSPAAQPSAPSLVPRSRIEPQSTADPKNAPVEPLAMPFTNQVFLIDGMPVFVEAPDSVRITQDDAGRVLLIHTSDGIIRIRLQN